jgi:hypothetical protein
MYMPYPRTDRDRLVRYWKARLDNHRNDGQVITWMTVEMRRICGSIGYPKWTKDTPGYSDFEPDSFNLYRVDVHGSETLARDVIQRIRTNAREFCRREFYLAMYDARMAIAPLNDKQTNIELARLKGEIDAGPRRASKGLPLASALAEPDMDIRNVCTQRWPSDYVMQEHCEKTQETARIWSKGRHTDASIGELCATRWHRDWDMYAYCVKQQEAAKVRLH